MEARRPVVYCIPKGRRGAQTRIEADPYELLDFRQVMALIAFVSVLKNPVSLMRGQERHMSTFKSILFL
jgi:hypothetical protein